MQLTQTIVAALFAASSVAAAPAPTEKSMLVQGIPEWTIEGAHRWCNKENTECHWKFAINPKIYSKTAVDFVVRNAGSTPAAQSNGGAQNFGDYTITSGWSGQFGPGNGFTTFAVVDNKHRIIAYPAYSDKEVENGQVVSPDKSYPAQGLP
ncbi:small secreted protein [Metarhizium guizhouense ARSEF 977]|uniref:Small secreted protein n=1 Tax=Metarhizium guizhouense (strain ARSEF 977) TaxID=1276136 RepID=A0A0B4H8L0_METGA|nr:small secreted protein [Metarhizium guizhouense ARSEF 977]